MKKNFFKKLALVMALTLAVGSVPATNVEAAAAPAFKSVAKGANLVEGQTKNYGIANVSAWSVKKIVVGNKKVATVKKSGKTAKITGVAEGKTTVRADLKAYKTKRTTSVKMAVYVKAAETPVVEAKLTGVKQTASNAFVATFAADAHEKFAAKDFTVAAVDGSSVLNVKSVEFSGDGLSAVVTNYTNFANGVTYDVTCGGEKETLTASIGEVKEVRIETVAAQENVKTPIEFKLIDTNGYDITSSVDLDSYCVVTVTGTHSGVETGKASKASIIMNGVGTTADVTVLYNSNKAGAADVTDTKTITCVDTKVVAGKKLFADTTNINNESDCAKFYLGLSDDVVSVAENETTDNVYFCAKDDKGEVISYDSYKVESSNEDVMNVEIKDSTDSGKFSRFTVTGNNIGSAQINITAEKNGKAMKYTIPVKVTKVNEAVKMSLTVTDPVMSDVVDYEYRGAIIPTLLDANDKEVDGTFTYEVTTKTTVGAGLKVNADGTYTAQEAVAKSYTVEVTGADNQTGKTFVKKVNITVKALPKDADMTTGNGIKVDYQVKLVKDTTKPINATSFDITATNSANLSTRLYATYNSIFAGYVRSDAQGENVFVGAESDSSTEGTVRIAAEKQLHSVKALARFGNLVFNTDAGLLGAGKDIETEYDDTLEAVESSWLVYNFIEDKDSDDNILYNEVVGGLTDKTSYEGSKQSYKDTDKAYSEVARTGRYVFEYAMIYQTDFDKDADKAKAKTVTQAFTLNNKVVVPTVAVTTRNVVGSEADDVIAVLKTNVDMNNNKSEHESIDKIYAADGTEPSATSNGTKLTVKYATVVDNYGTVTWTFYVPVNTTFTID